MSARPYRDILVVATAALLVAGCAGVKPLSTSERQGLARADTVYVLPSVARYSTKGFVLSRLDSVRTERLRARLDSLLLPELARALPGAVVVPGDSNDPNVLESAHVRLRARAFRRTVPRQALSAVSDIVLMIPTFGRNMARPVLPVASDLRLEVSRPGARRAPKVHHQDEVDADDPSELVFQVRKILDRGYRG